MTISRQHEWEQQLSQSAFQRAAKDDQLRRKTAYGSGSPFVAPLWQKYQNQFCQAMQKQWDYLLSDPNLKAEYKVWLGIANMFRELEPLKGEGDPDNLDHPFGWHLIARIVFASVTDVALLPSHADQLEHIQSSAVRGGLIQQLASDLSHQYFWRWHEQNFQAMQELGNPTDAKSLQIFYDTFESEEHIKEYATHLHQIKKQIQDPNAGLSQRRSRQNDLLDELRPGELIKTKGRPRKKLLRVPFREDPWDEQEAKLFACGMLDLLCIPKGCIEEPNDWRPFYINTEKKQDLQKSKANYDHIYVRKCLYEDMQFVRDYLSDVIVRFAPMLEQPDDWLYHTSPGSENNTGGFKLEKFKIEAPLVRCNDNEISRTIPSQFCLDFLNRLQGVEWILDQEQAELVRYLCIEHQGDFDGITRPRNYTWQELKTGTGLAAHLPMVQERARLLELAPTHRDDPEYQKQVEANNRLLKQEYRELALRKKLQKTNITLLSRMQELPDQPFFYAWSLDHRTRAYPLASTLSPQADHANRYSLKFHQGQHLSSDGEQFALRALGAAYNDTKGSINSRIDWAKSNLDLIREVAEGHDRALAIAKAADEPLQFLQLCRQWVAHEAGEQWHVPIYFDATNSGWALSSALLGSDQGCRATNLWTATADDAPADLYRLSADQVIRWITGVDPITDKKLKLTAAERSVVLEQICVDGPWRDMAKAVLVSAIYGSSHESWWEDLQEKLHSKDIKHDIFNRTVCTRLATLIVNAADNAVGGVLNANKAIKEMCLVAIFNAVGWEYHHAWKALSDERKRSDAEKTKYTKLCTEIGQKLLEKFPNGLGFYAADGSWVSLTATNTDDCRFTTLLHGTPTIIRRVTESPNIEQMFRQLPPALVHSTDAAQLKFTVQALPKDMPVTVVHDCIGCLPNESSLVIDSYLESTIKSVTPGRFTDLARDLGILNLVTEQPDQFKAINKLLNAPGGEWRQHARKAINFLN